MIRALLALLLSTTGAFAQAFSSPPYIFTTIIPTAAGMMQNYNRFVSDGNTSFLVLQNAVNAASGSPVPSGAVVAFNLSSCPTGWKASDGTLSTVDLRGYFPRITNGTPAVGTVQADQMTQHTHVVSGSYVSGASAFTTGSGSKSLATGFAAYAVNGASTGQSGSETRPKNVALLYCQKI